MNRQGICSGWEGCSCGVQGECVFCKELLRGGLAAEWGGKWEKGISSRGREGVGEGNGRGREGVGGVWGLVGRVRGERRGRATSRGLVGDVDLSKAVCDFFHDESCVFSHWAECPLTLRGGGGGRGGRGGGSILFGRAIYDVLQGGNGGGFPLCGSHGFQESGRATTVGEEGKGGNIWGWDTVKWGVVYKGNLDKFSQNKWARE